MTWLQLKLTASVQYHADGVTTVECAVHHFTLGGNQQACFPRKSDPPTREMGCSRRLNENFFEGYGIIFARLCESVDVMCTVIDVALRSLSACR